MAFLEIAAELGYRIFLEAVRSYLMTMLESGCTFEEERDSIRKTSVGREMPSDPHYKEADPILQEGIHWYH